MTNPSITQPWDELRRLADLGDASRLHSDLESLSGGEAARALSRLPSELQTLVLTTLEPEDAADVIEEMPDAQAALAINTIVAVSIGGTVPLLLRRFGVDPALASGPVLTTLTDMCGFFLVLSLATLALPHLASV